MSSSTTSDRNETLNSDCPNGRLIDVIISFQPSLKINKSYVKVTTPSPYLTTKELIDQISTVSIWQMYLIFVVLVFCTTLIVLLSRWVNRSIQKDQESVDSDFDAGGNASSGIMASSVVSYWTWAATLLQSTTVTALYGISGSYWYAAGASIQFLAFSVVTYQLKIKAPGAKTYLQIIKARFDKRTHLTFCAFALLTNFVVTAMLMLGGASVLTSLVTTLTVETGTLLITATIFTFTFVGGLNATMYVSYLTTAMTFAVVMTFHVQVFYVLKEEEMEAHVNVSGAMGSIEKLYNMLSCLKGPESNHDQSYLTFASVEGLIFGFINIVGNFGAVIIDQSYWQCAVAAKPFSAASGFLMAGMIWFAIPFTFGSTMGLAYRAIQVMDFNKTANWRALSDAQIDQGLVAPYVASRLMGNSGSMMCTLLVIMAVTSSGASQIIAVTSVLVYDIYQIYLKPYRAVFNCNTCLLCGREKGRMGHAKSKNICKCLSVTACRDCLMDNKMRSLESKRKAVKAAFTCTMHGSYRSYNEHIQRVKSWCQVIFTIAILPLTFALYYTSISLGWVYNFMGIVIGSSVIPVILTLTWTGLDGGAMSLGAICGPLLGFITTLVVAATKPGGLYYFFKNTGDEVSMLAGNIVSMASGVLITVLMSFVTNKLNNVNNNDRKEIWQMTRDIDNPLRPWTELYMEDLKLESTDLLHSKPSLELMAEKFKGVKYMAGSISLISIFVFLVVWPSIAYTVGTMDLAAFTQWIHLITAVAFLATIFVIIFPPIAEFVRIRTTLLAKNKIIDVNVAPKRIPTGSMHGVNLSEKMINFDGVVIDQKYATAFQIDLNEPQ